MSSTTTLRPDDFEMVRRLLRQHAALALDAGKEYLVEARLGALARRLGLASLEGLLAQLRNGCGPELRQQVIEAMTIHETSFFRDWKPFEALRREVLPKLLAARSARRELVIWSAACSTGQEPYSLAMMLREHLGPMHGWKIQLIATDISQDIINRARTGRYTQFEVNRGLPAQLLVKYFVQRGADWELVPEIRSTVEFRQLNLATPWFLPPIDIVLMRNVLIYFSTETRREILQRAHGQLRGDGYLLLGSGESPLHLLDSFEPMALDGACIYQPRGKA